MYLIELVLKIFSNKKEKTTYNPLEKEDEVVNYEACEHVFMPIDSTNEILSCSKCGLLAKRSELKNKNFFMQKKLTSS